MRLRGRSYETGKRRITSWPRQLFCCVYMAICHPTAVKLQRAGKFTTNKYDAFKTPPHYFQCTDHCDYHIIDYTTARSNLAEKNL